KDKREILRAIIDRDGEACRNAIIFCNRKTEVDVVAKSLKKHGYNAEPIHGDLDQSHRTRTLDGFRDGSVRFLVASDVAARGLDIPNVSHVFNFDVPSHAEDYVHRIGRTGRAGKTGLAYTIAVPSDEKYLDAIERLVDAKIPRGENPWTPPGKRDTGAEEAVAEDEAPKRTSRSRSRSRTKTADKVEAPATADEPAPREEPRRSRGGRGREDRGPKVVGLGDHVPSFIEMSFDERRAETA
ncbi:MAG: C-terminal helicase domain-containing protein, partial [Pseudomonadota bacterium]